MSQTKPIAVPEEWEAMPIHPLAALTEFGAGVDLDAGADEMKQDGYDSRESLVVYEGKLLDGRLRRSWAIRAGLTPTFCEFVGSNPIRFIRRKIMRQHLDIGQRAMFAAKLATLESGHDGSEAQYCAPDSEPLSINEAAKSVGVSPRAVDYATVVQEHGTKSLQRAVNVGQVKVSDAAKVARKAKPIQDYAVGAVQAKLFRTVAEAATLCPRCEKRVKKDQQPTTNCPACDDIRKNGKPKKTPKAKAKKPTPPPEQKTFGWAEFKSSVTGLHAFIDSLGRNDKPQLHERLDFLVEMIGPEPSNEKANPDALFDNERADTGPYRSGR